MQFEFSMPTTINFGPGVSQNIGNILKDMGAKRVFFVYDKGVKSAGLVDGALKAMKDAGVELYEYDDVLPNPPDHQVHRAAEIAKNFNADAIVALGGGSSIDSAKAINILLTNPGPIAAYDGFHLVKNPCKPLIVIPTTAGTGSEVTVVTVVTNTTTLKKMIIFGRYVNPTLALIDPELTYNLPPSITASTGMDALVHGIESYLSTMASPPTMALSLESVKVVSRSIRRAFHNGKDKEARSDMLLGSMLAGMCFTNTSLGLVHSIAHPLGAHYNVPHGVANAIGLAAVMEFNIPAITPEQMHALANALGVPCEGKTHEQLGKAIADFLQALTDEIKIPRLSEINLPETALPVIAKAAVEEASMLTTPRKATEEEVLEILRKIW